MVSRGYGDLGVIYVGFRGCVGSKCLWESRVFDLGSIWGVGNVQFRKFVRSSMYVGSWGVLGMDDL